MSLQTNFKLLNFLDTTVENLSSKQIIKIVNFLDNPIKEKWVEFPSFIKNKLLLLAKHINRNKLYTKLNKTDKKQVVNIINIIFSYYKNERWHCNALYGTCSKIRKNRDDQYNNKEYMSRERCLNKCSKESLLDKGLSETIVKYLSDKDKFNLLKGQRLKTEKILTSLTDQYNLKDVPHKNWNLLKNIKVTTLTELKIIAMNKNTIFKKVKSLEIRIPTLYSLNTTTNTTVQNNIQDLSRVGVNNKFYSPEYYLSNLPKHLENLGIIINDFNNSLNKIPKGLKSLRIKSNEFNKPIDILPDNLQDLYIISNKFNKPIDNLPDNLQKLSIISNEFNEPIDVLPDNLQELYIRSPVLNQPINREMLNKKLRIYEIIIGFIKYKKSR
jgi:hypothetical protein